MNLQCILVDDEPNNIEALCLLLELLPGVQIQHCFTKPEEAYHHILRNPPNILFLALEMQGMSGIELLERLPDLPMSVIFVTAYNELSVKALRVNAIDYVLKPVLLSDLKAAVEKAKAHQHHKERFKPVDDERLAVTTANGIEFIQAAMIMRLNCAGTDTELVLLNGSKLVVSGNLGEFETLLLPYGFFRCHSSHIVNPKYLVRYLKEDGGSLVMTDGSTVPVARRRKDGFLNLFTP
jgi:two-component system LytT family response regulator